MELSTLLAAVPLVVVSGVLVAALASAPATPLPDEMRRHYRWGAFYYNKADSDTFVPKRRGVGFTLNFARWTAWLCLAVFVVIPTAAAILMATRR